MSQKESINLFYTEGSSDKVYQAQLEEKGGGWVVNFQYGRRGSALKAGTKTASPVEFSVAKKEYDALVRSKTSKGYTLDESGSVYQDTDAGQDFTGIAPQLLTDVRDEDDIESLIVDPNWIAQEKYDGERRMIKKDNDKVFGINRTGMRIALPVVLADEAGSLNANQFLIDGEALGDRLYAFDLLELDGKDIRGLSVLARMEKLVELAGKCKAIKVVSTAFSVSEKREMIARIKGARGEGVVFKNKDATYVPGRPASGGNQRKWKFVASATVRVASIHATKRSIGMECDDGKKGVKLGNCMVPTNHPIPKVGDLGEVRYLYLYEKGSLYQPQWGGLRKDKTECDQLISFKLKANGPTDEDDDIVVEAEADPKIKTKRALA